VRRHDLLELEDAAVLVTTTAAWSAGTSRSPQRNSMCATPAAFEATAATTP
jgi:hypothetical protein